MTNQVPKHTTSEASDDPGAVDRQEHEAEVGRRPAARRAPDRTGPDAPNTGASDALDDQRQAEGQQQAVEGVEPVQVPQQQALDDDAEHTDQRAARTSSATQ